MSRRTTIALFTALGCTALAVLIWFLAFRTGAGGAADTAALRGFAQLQGTWVAVVASGVAHLCDPAPYALLAGTVTVLALSTRGPRGALAVAAILVIPNVVTQQLKTALAEGRVHGPRTIAVHIDPASWPSGHSTAAMALVLCAVIASPAGARRLVAVGGALFAAAVAYAVVLLGWHFPSDALGGFAVAGAAASLGVAALSAAEEQPGPARSRAGIFGLTALALALVAVLLARVAAGMPGTDGQLAFLAGGGAIAVFGVALAAGVAGGVSRPAARAAPQPRSRRARG